MPPQGSRTALVLRLSLGLAAAAALSATATLSAQIPGRNINMVSGTDWPGGDPFLQRQNEPSLAASTRNPLHLVGGSNDYRTVDLPGLPDGVETGDAWLGVYKSFDGGERWASTLLPGYPQDQSPAGLASPLKGYQAGADPVVRAGTSGLVYYNGLVFDRGENGRSAVFVARFIDRNNKENGDPIAYLGASLVAQSSGGAFLDKPWMAVDIPRGSAPPLCIVSGGPGGGVVARSGHKQAGRGAGSGNTPPDDGVERVPAGAIYVAYSSITGSGPTLRSEILIKRSSDCGVTWTAPVRVSRPADRINQGVTLAIDPRTGAVFVAWRRFSSPDQPNADAILVARLPVGGGAVGGPGLARGFERYGPATEAIDRIFEHRQKRAQGPTDVADIQQLDQGTTRFSFRTNAYPTMAVDESGRAYIAWTERGFAAVRPHPVDGDARILITTTTDARSFSAPVVVDDPPQPGHQLMPSLAYAGGRLMLVYYDLRETRAQLFSRFITDDPLQPSYNNLRHTIDIRAAVGLPGPRPVFGSSAQVSDYRVGATSATGPVRQLQVNPPNLPMFRLGTVPFMGDYIDVAAAPAFVPAAGGGWAFNTADTGQFPVFHAAWTDNRDVRPPLADFNQDGNPWNDYTPPGPGAATSLFDATQPVPACVPGNWGSRNQNVYTARVGGGLVVGAPGNAKPLSPTRQRAFVVFAHNQTTTARTYRLRVLAQPAGGRASFEQFPLPPYTAASPPPVAAIDVTVPPRSTASRTVYVTASDPHAQVLVGISEITGVGGTPLPGGSAGTVILNPDIENPDIENPDIENPDIENPDIENAEVYNPDIENPDIENPDIENPDIENPDIENPDIENVRVANPDIENTTVANPDIENPDIENPDIENPDIENPDIENAVFSDITWTVSNTGNTTSAFNAYVFLASAAIPDGLATQLILYKTYTTPVALNSATGCDLRVETQNLLVANIPSPAFITPGVSVPGQNDPSAKSATLWLAPGERARITLRVYDPDPTDNLTWTNADGRRASIDPAFDPATRVTLGIAAQGVDGFDPPGATRPPIITTTGSNVVFLQHPTAAPAGGAFDPPVSVRVWDNAGAPLAGVTVTMSLVDPPAGAALLGTTTAVSDTDGIAVFTSLSVNQPGTYRLRASAEAAGVIASGTSVGFVVFDPMPASIDSVRPSSGAPGEGLLVLRGTGLPPPETATVTVSGAAAAGAGLVFLPPSTTSAYWVRLPPGFPLGPAMLSVRGAGIQSHAVPITVTAVPGTPVITGVFGTDGAPVTAIAPGIPMLVAADGIDTTGAVVRFEQSTGAWNVPATSTASNAAIGVAAVVTPPAALKAGTPVKIRIRQGPGAFSAPVTLGVAP